MSYTSKFTEIFDIDPSDPILQEINAPPSPKSCPVYYSPELDLSHSSLHSQISSKSTNTKGIAIPQKKRNAITVTPPCSPPRNSEKHHEALASKLKKIVNSISKKKDSSSSVPFSFSKSIPTK
ncbi:hypothetical protein BDF21DRAFT_408998 [Thamnidium elegans]|uniref:Uncharacterized protein n=1 Tax=Thamnidium elegans TaxID=101142 RepID=A0A8H7SSB0_9FUNG|nr:hypothetical protein INT48_004324 [Thamnidium elegans]KAI8094551.1 hypothetical protein BDF21DRAFT_408998 [Thamnidium elegans]